MTWYDVNNIALTLFDYPLSYIELLGTVFGLLSVWLAAKANIWTWPAGIINEFAFFALFFQVQLYSDMFLQVFFFAVTMYGWYYWKRQPEQDSVGRLTKNSIPIYAGILLVGTLVLGAFMTRIHLLLPELFALPAAYPFADAFTTVASILATILLARKKIETWILWIVVDVVSVTLYFMKGINLVAIEYVVFLMICIFGFVSWRKKLGVNKNIVT